MNVLHWKGFIIVGKASMIWSIAAIKAAKEGNELVVFEIPKDDMKVISEIENFLQKRYSSNADE